MTSMMSIAANQPNDAQLVSASRGGDREAFGQIVRRYQGMISGLIYAACGDLHRSEDLAQETFLSAWKSLSGLREPAKLPAWLCQIARHRAQDQLRKSSSEKSVIAKFWSHIPETAAPADQEMLRNEEAAVLWRALAEIPQPYRETLVLYYRQGQSTEHVAAAMETSEAAVRQRLARGREMLRTQVAELIERNLAATAPSLAFAIAVIGALPAIAPGAATAGVGTALKGSLAANSGWLSYVIPLLGTIGGVAGGIAGTCGALRDDKTPAERKLTLGFLLKLWLLVGILLLALHQIFRSRHQLGWSDQNFMTILAGVFTGYWAIAATLVLRYQINSLRLRDPNRPLKIGIVMTILIVAGPAVGALEWLISLSLAAHDRLSAAIVAAAIIAITAIGFRVVRRSIHSLMLIDTLAFAIVIVAMLNWRLNDWMTTISGIHPATHLSLNIVNLLALSVVLWIAAMTYFATRSTPRQSDPETVGVELDKSR
ncbi:MAG TPA: RNA polymerase sigma factor [Tepidisphaeraceae bacterium]|jgi:RNA polymerase sigma factor (sigma-70 family)